MPKKKMNRLERWFVFLRSVERFVRFFRSYKKVGNWHETETNCIFVCNHYSAYDIAYPIAITKRPVHFLAKKNLWKMKIGEWFFNKCQAIPVNRDGDDLKALMSALRYLKSGDSVCIFPEGTRNKTDEPLLPFKAGACAIAIKAQVPIIPIFQMSKHKPFRRTPVIVGEPIVFSEYFGKKITQDELKLCDDKLYATMLQMRENYIAEHTH